MRQVTRKCVEAFKADAKGTFKISYSNYVGGVRDKVVKLHGENKKSYFLFGAELVRLEGNILTVRGWDSCVSAERINGFLDSFCVPCFFRRGQKSGFYSDYKNKIYKNKIADDFIQFDIMTGKIINQK